MTDRDDFDVRGQRVLVTGSTRGLGEAVARYLAGHGVDVAVHGRDEERLGKVRASLEELGATVVAVTGDVRDPEAARRLVDDAAEGLGGLDGVVNNAGGTFGAPAAEMSPNAFAAVVTENLTSAFTVARFAFPHLQRSRGTLINIGSAAALHASPRFSHYAAAKAGLVSLTSSLAAEWGPHGIRVNAVLPGLMATDAALESLFDHDPSKIEEAAAKIGVGRLGRPEELGMMCRFLLSSAASFVHGAAVVLDGGPPDVPSF